MYLLEADNRIFQIFWVFLEKLFGDFIGVLKIDEAVDQYVIDILLFIFFVFSV